MRRPLSALLAAATLPLASTTLHAQQASLTYMLGKDTLAVEQWSRTGNTLSGDMVQRSGPAIIRVHYAITVGRDGKPTSASLQRMQADGTPVPNTPREYKFSITADSIVRETVWADSTQRRAFAAKGAVVNFPTFVYGPTELLAAMKRAGGSLDSIPALGAQGGLGFAGLTHLEGNASGSTTRLRGGGYAMILKYDGRDRLMSVDGSFTTNKAMATRGNGGMDVAAVARAMKPTGVLSGRADARAAFGPGGMVVVDYGRPMVRERTVWGGQLVPMDSIWRAGANDATHLFTTRTLAFGSTTLAPGMYTLWVQHTANGTWLIINKQTGQWGTQYDAANDLGRVALEMSNLNEHVEEFTITVRAVNPQTGRIELAWGEKVAGVNFGVSAARP